MAADETPHYHGHRQRLRGRFLAHGAEGFADYELLELLLFWAIPRQDTKPLAKALIRAFGSYAGVLHADAAALAAVPGMGEASAALLKLVDASIDRTLRQEILHREVLSSWDRLLAYCGKVMGQDSIESVRLLFLDSRNALIADEVQQTGTVNHAPLYPREVVRRGLELGAAAFIIVHNHPSGDPTPSRADIDTTREIAKAAAPLGLNLHDHLIIGAGGRHASLKSLGLF